MRKSGTGLETKKEYIIRLAKEDPFLKIEEIAEKAATTARYVRVLLSEANLSLMNLREEYARKMERNAESRIVLSLKDLTAFGLSPEDGALQFTYGPSEVYWLQASEQFPWNTDHRPLYQYIQPILCNERPCGLVVLITGIGRKSRELQANVSLISLLGWRPDELRLSHPEIEFGTLPAWLSAEPWGAEWVSEAPMVKIKTFLSYQGVVTGEEMFFFPANYIKLTIPGMFSPSLEFHGDER